MEEPILSVIMAVYNCEKTLNKCIDSILNQTFKRWVFIICDDGSTDNTMSILYDFQKEHPEKFIIIKNKQNSKLPYSLNHCLKYVKTEYVARMDGDDWSEPERFEKQIDFLENHPEYDLVGTGVSVFDGKKVIASIKKPQYPTSNDMINGSSFSHATIMTHKYVYDQLGGYSLDKTALRVEDIELWFRFFSKGFKGYNIQEDYYTILEDDNAVKRRNLSARYNSAITRYRGLELLGISGIKRYKPFLIIIRAFVPVKINKIIHKYRLKKGIN